MPTPRLFRALVLPLALAGVLGTASPALACDGGTVQSIFFQAAKYSHVHDGYGVACLRQALQAQPSDLLTYSNSDSAIRAAISKAVVQVQIPANRGSNTDPKRFQQGLAQDQASPGTATVAIADTGPLGRFINAGAHSPGAVPVPVIVLGVVAFLLLGGGVASIVVRRRLEPPGSSLKR